QPPGGPAEPGRWLRQLGRCGGACGPQVATRIAVVSTIAGEVDVHAAPGTVRASALRHCVKRRRQCGCLAGGPEHRDGVGRDVRDTVLAFLRGEGQSRVWADAERGQVVVPAGDDGSACDWVFVEGTEVESVDVGLPVAGAYVGESGGAAVAVVISGRLHRQ